MVRSSVILSVLKGSEVDKLEKMSKHLRGFMYKAVIPFTRNVALMRLEDVDSLLNVCLERLNIAIDIFKYDVALTEEHNIGRFLSLCNKLFRNALNDKLYKVNVMKCKSSLPVFDIDSCFGDDDMCFDIHDPACHDVTSYAIASEAREFLLSGLTGQTREIAELRLLGLDSEDISRKLGIATSTVRYFLSSRIRERLSAYYRSRD